MPKKTKNRSSRQAKQARQNANRARRNAPVYGAVRPLEVMGVIPASHDDILKAFGEAWDSGVLQMATGPNGQIREITVEQIAENINTALAGDGEPAADPEEVKSIASEDILQGTMWLRPDGVWETQIDYFA
jgi:hypothetical protein